MLIACFFTFTAAANNGGKTAVTKVNKAKKHNIGKKQPLGYSLIVSIVNGAGCASPYRIIVTRADNFAVVRDVAGWTASSIRFNNLPIGPRFFVQVLTTSCSGSATSPGTGGLVGNVTVTIRR